MFTTNEAVVLNFSKFSVREKDILSIAPRNKSNSLYKFLPKEKTKCYGTVGTVRPENTVNSDEQERKRVKNEPISLWHKRLIHINVKLLEKLHLYARNIPMMSVKRNSFHPCYFEKANKNNFEEAI